MNNKIGDAEMETRETKLKKIALEVFGSSDGLRPRMPTRGEDIQIAMELSFNEGKRDGKSGAADHLKATGQFCVKNCPLLEMQRLRSRKKSVHWLRNSLLG